MSGTKRESSRFKKDAAPVDPTRVPVGIDHSTFFTPQIPETVHAAVPLLHALSAADQAVVVSAALALYLSLEQEQGGEGQGPILRPDALRHVADSDYAVVLSGAYDIVKTALRVKVHSSILAQNLKTMFLPEPFAAALVQAVGKERARLEGAAVARRVRLPTLAGLRWRVDVCISSGLLSRVMRPNILLQCTLSSGEIKTFEVSVEQFNQLRYGTAKVLHDMQMLDRHPIMRVVNELERKDAEDRQKNK